MTSTCFSYPLRQPLSPIGFNCCQATCWFSPLPPSSLPQKKKSTTNSNKDIIILIIIIKANNTTYLASSPSRFFMRPPGQTPRTTHSFLFFFSAPCVRSSSATPMWWWTMPASWTLRRTHLVSVRFRVVWLGARDAGTEKWNDSYKPSPGWFHLRELLGSFPHSLLSTSKLGDRDAGAKDENVWNTSTGSRAWEINLTRGDLLPRPFGHLRFWNRNPM